MSAEFVGGEIEFIPSVELKTILEDYISEELKAWVKTASSYMYLPYENTAYDRSWSDYDGADKVVTDPLTIRFSTELCSDINGIKFDASLSEVIDNLIDGHISFSHKRLVASCVPAFKTIAEALQKEVDKLNSVIADAHEEVV